MMKRFTVLGIILLILCLFLTACSINTPDPVVGDPALLEFPGLKWGMMPDEVKDALQLSEKQIAMDQMTGHTDALSADQWVIIADDLEFFDREIQSAYFTFYRYAGEKFGLAQVTLYYPDDTDMLALRDELLDVYGEGLTGKTTVSFDSEGNPHYLDQTELFQGLYVQWWESEPVLTTMFSKEEQNSIIAHYAELQPLASRDTIAEVLSYAHVSLDCGETSEQVEIYEDKNPYISRKHVSYNAVTIVEWMQKFGK